jgi:hypothetical protein
VPFRTTFRRRRAVSGWLGPADLRSRGGAGGDRSEVRDRALGVRRTLDRGCPLEAPDVRERADVDRVVTELVEQLGGLGLSVHVVAGDRQRRAVGRAMWAREGGQVLKEDVVEPFTTCDRPRCTVLTSSRR